MSNETSIQKSPSARLKAVLEVPSVSEQFQNTLKENAPSFLASLIELYGSDTKLQQCEPKAVIMEALKAATLRLPINRNLGFAWILPYNVTQKDKTKKMPIFQMGYKGYLQLAIRSGQYRVINAGFIYEGMRVDQDHLTGDMAIFGEKKSDDIVGYFAYFETLNGYRKGIAWTKQEALAHGKRYSPSFGYASSGWQTNPDAMCRKSVISNLLRNWGILSVEMEQAFSTDHDEIATAQEDIDRNANVGAVIDIQEEPSGEKDSVPSKKAAKTKAGPDF